MDFLLEVIGDILGENAKRWLERAIEKMSCCGCIVVFGVFLLIVVQISKYYAGDP